MLKKLIKRLLRIEAEGVSVLKQFKAHRVHKTGYGRYQVLLSDLYTIYDFEYHPEDGTAELWCGRDLAYSTENEVEAMEMYLYLKGLYNGDK